MFFAFIALMLSAIITFACYSYCSNDFKSIYVTVAGIISFLHLFFLLSVQCYDVRKSINIKTATFFLLLLNILLLFVFSDSRNLSLFLILNATVLTVLISLVYGILNTKT